MTKLWLRRLFLAIALTASTAICLAQGPPAAPAAPVSPVEQPDSERTREELNQLLQRYPPEVRGVLQLDNGLLTNQTYLASWPALVNFVKIHPEIARNPTYYLGVPSFRGGGNRYSTADVWRDAIQGFEVVLGMALFFGLIAWLTRTLVDHRRWNRQNKVLTDVHSRLLERFSGNDELLAYIQSPAGSKFLESSPIRLDSPSQSSGAPFGRILWTVQAGVVLSAAGGGLLIVAGQNTSEVSAPLHALGVLSIALGVGFVASALISFLISRRLGLVELPAKVQN